MKRILALLVSLFLIMGCTSTGLTPAQDQALNLSTKIAVKHFVRDVCSKKDCKPAVSIQVLDVVIGDVKSGKLEAFNTAKNMLIMVTVDDPVLASDLKDLATLIDLDLTKQIDMTALSSEQIKSTQAKLIMLLEGAKEGLKLVDGSK